MTRQVCFSHGQESGPWGTKIRALAELAESCGWSVASVDYQGMHDPLDRVERLLAQCRDYAPTDTVVLVGSSMGGYVSAAAAGTLSVAGLFLMAPALYVPGYEEILPAAPPCPVTIIHGWRDEVVPPQSSIRYAGDCRARLVLVDGDHRLTANLAEISRFFTQFLSEITG